MLNTRTHLRAKGLVGTRGGGMMFEKYFSISFMYNTKSDHLSPYKSGISMEIGNQMQKLKIQTNSKLIYEVESI